MTIRGRFAHIRTILLLRSNILYVNWFLVFDLTKFGSNAEQMSTVFLMS